MLKQISKIFFIWYFISVFFIFFISNFLKLKLEIWENFIFLILICLIPLFENILNIIKNDSEKINFWFKFDDNIFKYSILWFFSIFLLFFVNLDFLEFITIFLLTFGIIFKIDARYFFSVSLLFVILICFELIMTNKQSAETLAIYSYYYLIIWTLLSFFQNKKISQKNEKIKEKQNIFTKFFKIEILFLIYFWIILILIFPKKYEFIKYFSIILFSIFIIWNFAWNKIDLSKNIDLPKADKNKFFITSGIIWMIFFKILTPNTENHYFIMLWLFLLIIAFKKAINK